ncbi:hypothetical protein RAC89_15090 [Paenibacillus sp. GD4]|uniref:hypothetical protein n=1 Tax=Paenibacillus sp. GD4 TaxID=3068890 RepID=UPI002796C631|nr:hypothetical protein [Paenibacillus sp. GD4]MDQ1911727.1 hypothetical protein [Paenibacillus sp. GD4]
MYQINIGTVLLEKNRWGSRLPSFRVSEWIDRFHADRFDGIELWENHAMLCGEEELELLRKYGAPIEVFNSYASFDEEGAAHRQAAAKLIRALSARGVKYNLGKQASEMETYLDNLYRWAEQLPEDFRLLCECHPGTVMEDPAFAEKVFRQFKDTRFQAIVHFPSTPEQLDEWFGRLGGTISHIHVQLRNTQNECVKLESDPERVDQGIEILAKYNYRGTFTIEFTEGVSSHENKEELYHAAVADSRFLRSLLTY